MIPASGQERGSEPGNLFNPQTKRTLRQQNPVVFTQNLSLEYNINKHDFERSINYFINHLLACNLIILI